MDPVTLLIIGAVIILVIGRRLAGEPLSARRVAVMPLLLLVIGVYEFGKSDPHMTTADWGAVAVEMVMMLVLGAVRGLTIALYERDGHLWLRYRWSTVAVWVVSIALRLGVGAVASSAGVHLPSSALFLTLGVSFVGEALVVGPRALASGTAFAPSSSQRRGGAQGGERGSAAPTPSRRGR